MLLLLLLLLLRALLIAVWESRRVGAAFQLNDGGTRTTPTTPPTLWLSADVVPSRAEHGAATG